MFLILCLQGAPVTARRMVVTQFLGHSMNIVKVCAALRQAVVVL